MEQKKQLLHTTYVSMRVVYVFHALPNSKFEKRFVYVYE